MASARDRVLDAYESLLIDSGPAAATLDAVAAAAEISKGGLLYHFGSKDALVGGLLERLTARGAADAESLRRAPEGAVAYHLRTSAPGRDTPGGLTRTYLAVLRLADGTDAGRAVRDALGVVDAEALAALRDELDDPVLAWLVQLVGDGLYLRTLTGSPLPPDMGVADLLARMRRYLPARPGGPGGS